MLSKYFQNCFFFFNVSSSMVTNINKNPRIFGKGEKMSKNYWIILKREVIQKKMEENEKKIFQQNVGCYIKPRLKILKSQVFWCTIFMVFSKMVSTSYPNFFYKYNLHEKYILDVKNTSHKTSYHFFFFI